MPKKMCTDCNTRPASKESPEGQLCIPCLRYAETENEHSDYGHDEDGTAAHPDCPVCHPELDPRNDTPRTGHTNTIAKTYSSHAGCTHARTPKMREICRRERRANA
jgi:hypothetical protein